MQGRDTGHGRGALAVAAGRAQAVVSPALGCCSPCTRRFTPPRWRTEGAPWCCTTATPSCPTCKPPTSPCAGPSWDTPRGRRRRYVTCTAGRTSAPVLAPSRQRCGPQHWLQGGGPRLLSAAVACQGPAAPALAVSNSRRACLLGTAACCRACFMSRILYVEAAVVVSAPSWWRSRRHQASGSAPPPAVQVRLHDVAALRITPLDPQPAHADSLQ